ncbi:hypothetical protein LSAT2_015183 [Lamellibrachia satsuma]|nr:hypothetical protein LSAT2_015183 [Lamellibrachia satsuma]
MSGATGGEFESTNVVLGYSPEAPHAHPPFSGFAFYAARVNMAWSNAEDDLDFNPFYKILQTKFKAAFEEAQVKCCMICIPHSSSIQGIQFDKLFVDMHIVKPSPYFKGVYVTTDKNNTGSLSLEQNILETGQGFPEKVSARILAEELGYNKDYKPYKILLIDRPLTGEITAVAGKDSSCDRPTMFDLNTSLSECQAFLNSIPECQQVVQSDVEQAITSFEKNYMVLKGFLSDAAEKIKKMYTDMSQKMLRSLPATLSCDQRIFDNVNRAVESVILSRVHGRVFPIISEECKRENAELGVKVQQLRKTSHDKLRFDKRFQHPQPGAIAELRRLSSLKTPLEKLACMKTTLDTITKTLETHLSQQLGCKLSDVPRVSSDDLISLLVSVIIQCRDLQLPSDIFFIEHFHWTSSAVDNISYCFVTFKAAVQFILSLDVTPEEHVNSRPLPQQQDSLEKRYVDLDIDSQALPRLLDQSLSVMTRRVELSTRDFVEANKMSTPPGRRPIGSSDKTEERRKHLGDFLSSLQDDVCCSSYGKQT